MPTTKSKGQKWGLYVYITSAYVKFAALKSFDFNRLKELIDQTDFDNNDDASTISGTRSANVSMSSLYAYDNTTHTTLTTLYEGEAAGSFSVRGYASGWPAIHFAAHVREYNRSMALNEMATLSITLEVTGIVSEGTIT